MSTKQNSTRLDRNLSIPLHHMYAAWSDSLGVGASTDAADAAAERAAETDNGQPVWVPNPAPPRPKVGRPMSAKSRPSSGTASRPMSASSRPTSANSRPLPEGVHTGSEVVSSERSATSRPSSGAGSRPRSAKSLSRPPVRQQTTAGSNGRPDSSLAPPDPIHPIQEADEERERFTSPR